MQIFLPTVSMPPFKALAVCTLTFCCFIMPVYLTGQIWEAENQSDLSIKQAMQGEQFIGYSPGDISWHALSENIRFSWNPDMELIRSTWIYNKEGEEVQKLTPELHEQIFPIGTFTQDRSQMVYTRDGNLFLLDVNDGSARQLVKIEDNISSPSFSGDENHIIYTLDNNLYRFSISDGGIEQLINFKSGSESQPPESPPNEKWLENQIELMETLEVREKRREMAQKTRDEFTGPGIPAVYTGNQSVSEQKLCPQMRYITWRQTHTPDIKYTDVPNYVTKSGHVEQIRSRPKVGHPQSTYEFWIYDLERDTAYEVGTEQIPGIFDKPDFLKDYIEEGEEFDPLYEDPREVIFHGPDYSDDGKAVVVIRSLDNKDRWIMKLDLKTGELELLDRQRDEAWIGGPGIVGWNFTAGNTGWLKDNEHFYFQSEETGYSHLYQVHVESGEITQLTSGDWEVHAVELSHDGETFYITANPESPFEHHFYHLPVEGGEMNKLTSQRGGHQISISPDQKHLAIRYSTGNQPWELYYMPNEAGAEMSRITHSTTEDFEAFDWIDPEIIHIEARDGARVPARIYEPDEDIKNGAAVIFVHGAGYLQNVHHWWSSYFREYMFHHILRDNGFTVLDIDFRASAGYGRDWRTAIYRHMGGKDLTDQVDGAKWLVEEKGIDPDRIGIYGGSYGGFITLMGMFLEPETFAAGAALRSVTDWAHYNHGYTSNILNTPVEDSLAFVRSSPIYHAEGLEGPLLILHGVIDVNVQYQDVVRLAQRLIELEKEDWELAAYPLEDHGFIEPSAWTDEYRRIFHLFTTRLLE